MNKQKCVYIITNDFDDKKYIGVAEDFDKRMYQHAKGQDAAHSYIDKSILVHGWEHFSARIIDNYTTIEERKQLEQKYIKEYNTLRINGGYNLTIGGEDLFGDIDVSGSNNPRAQLDEEDVKQIRIRRMNGERMSVVYEDYKDKLLNNKRAGFSKIWLHESWIEICSEFKGHYPEIDTKYYATIRRNNLNEKDLEFLESYFKWYGPVSKYNELYKTFKEKIDWESFQEKCKKIVEKLYGNASTRRYRNKNGETQKRIDNFRKELQTPPNYS